jgi:aspartyl-tRNA(Asn)/glutamyl-tRNA(Gln) amidotransferase subunit C
MSSAKKLEKKDILHLAKLANLSISDEEVEKYLSQLEQTLSYVENMQELDTSAIDGTAHSTQFDNIYFKDGTTNTRGLSPEEALANTSQKKDSLFKVGRIL